MIRPATPEDAATIAAMTRALSGHVGDLGQHRGSADTLRRDFARFRVLIAENGSTASGMVLFFPYYSSLRGEMGLYVQDLFVGANARGTGLGRALLAAAGRAARDEWDARFLILSAARSNETALAFYDRLGMAPHDDAVQLSLEGAQFTQLTETA
ncbi:GNAT family N-acetyltransferase [Lutimaribacter sp. EGI FJ00015]|uniref:GNAT family N-acetyltransferase n=1 Tax=Lutimaribacter degradans TaxID=2945989 RepID=A0ACC5ZS63_9RHOB|nr:GNAT family N-acetyltransferase [Lutimaribacter sp. EGI FJ00013]MCM2561158.1 GNAT family N-acetyltransferase [Lutimaribacter sp. EGI FJ00013]MCO0611893.1 GNAT family N-acetyltransferase [Lutimaribacter sp. EGI FJ00015]MCO0634986.1 GNAT family N-acetyltransferase [Lutimaribacter sp. EGI FJ00014]